MKAKELKDEKYFQHAVNGEVISEGYLFSEEEMSIFWSQLCKEQRRICGAIQSNENPFVSQRSRLMDVIINAPEPEID